ncbi:MAG: glycosyl hydrolase family 18 protein [Candidatus Levyibacteriota bacterium]
MNKNLLMGAGVLVLGIGFALLITISQPMIAKQQAIQREAQLPKQVIGFLPYWLLAKAKPDYSSSITTLTYFGLNVGSNGHIITLTSPTETDPGWNALDSGIFNPFLTNAQHHHMKTSLLIDSGSVDAIDQMVLNPTEHANNLMNDVLPVMKHYGFSDLNLDIEYTADASPAAQANFTQFVKTVKQQLVTNHAGTLTVEISPTDVIRHELINVHDMGTIADTVVLMAYDYHSTASTVTGAVAPQNGAGTSLEYDVATAITKAKAGVPSQKLILGLPLYGYEWETMTASPRAAIIPGTGLTASSMRAQSLLASCASCSSDFNSQTQELFVAYKDQETGTYHQFFVPNEASIKAKINYANAQELGGLALWALGYEDGTMLQPLTSYIK